MPSRRKIDRPALTPAGARDKALRALSRREHSAAELRHKLEHRGLEKQAAKDVVERLAESGWQSDARYAETLVRSRIAQGYGPLRIEAEMEHAGVAAAQIGAALLAADADWKALARQLHLRRFGRKPPAQAAEWQKQYRYLAGRGFTAEQVRAALKGAPEGVDQV